MVGLRVAPADIASALRAGDTSVAARLARAEAARGAENPALLNLAAYECLKTGELDDALQLLERAHKLAPGDANVLNSLGFVHRRRGDTTKALQVFRRACEIDPTNTAAHFNLAQLFEDLDERNAASAHYEAVLLHAPNDTEALSRLFYLRAVSGDYEAAAAFGQRAAGPQSAEAVFGQIATIALQRADFAAARRFAEHAIAANPTPRALTTLAHAEFRCGAPEDAHRRLTDLLASQLMPDDRAFALSLLGDVEDKLGDTAAAFSNYAQSKAILSHTYAPQFAAPGQRTGLALVRDLHAFFANHRLGWQASIASQQNAAPRAHVFLVGFPRSGTTLLEQMLALHPEVRTIDEVDALMSASTSLWSSPEALRAFAAGDKDALSNSLAEYWRGIRQRVPDLDHKILIDKMPLNCLLLPHIARLFPNAKIIFAVRDPRDVVFSCFRTRFGMTAFMYEFCALKSAARFYDAVMGLCELYRETLPLALLETRYEDLVANFDKHLGAVCQFLGVEATPTMTKPEQRSRSRIVSTPSSAQIARGLYDGSAQWRRYAAHMREVLPALQRWTERFGYPAS